MHQHVKIPPNPGVPIFANIQPKIFKNVAKFFFFLCDVRIENLNHILGITKNCFKAIT